MLLHEQRFDHLLLNLDLFANVVFDAQGQESFRPCKLRNVRTQSEAESPTFGGITRMTNSAFPLDMNTIYVSEHLEQELNFVTKELLVVTVRELSALFLTLVVVGPDRKPRRTHCHRHDLHVLSPAALRHV